MLTDEIGMPSIVDWDDPDRQVLEVDDSVDARTARRREHLVMGHPYPPVVIDVALGEHSPGASFFRGHQGKPG
jgi:hypothetical protein